MKNLIKFNNILLIAVAIFFQSCMKTVDLIAYNGNIYTVDENFSRASAFAVKNGKFIDVGSNNILSKYNSKNILDLKGSTVLPGLIDAHCHFYGLGLNQNVIDLTGTKSFDEIIEKISKDDKKSVIRGRGWDQNDWELKKFPNKSKLDLLYPQKPVILERIDGHAYLVNQKALDIANIDINIKSENGTVIIEKGKLTGVLIDGPMSLIDKAFGDISELEKIDALLSAQDICFENGLTTVDDAGIQKDIILLIDSLQKQNQLKIRVYAMISNSKDDVNYFLEKGPIKTDLLNVRSVKVYGDGALGSRGATLKAPYSDDKHNYGKLVTDIQSIKELAKKLSAANFQMNTHAIGDSTINILLKSYSNVLENKEDPRWRIEHSQIVDLNDINGYNEKILPSVQPTHATSDMYWAEDRVGSKRIKGAYANKELLLRSKVIGLGTDFPVEKVNPFHTFYAATARKDLYNYPEDGFEFSNALSREETLKGMTIWAAYLNFEENEKGSIEKNKFADFIIIDRDIMKVDIDLTPYTKVLKTYLSGDLVYSYTDSN
ncbi:MAG: amidohydrolase [Flavobacteriaceae bacterium]|nr:amidohydrolase [Flavobacteriaceae bacterium]